MPRILGVDIPNDRKTVVSLTYLYGVGEKTARELCQKTGIDPDKRARDLVEDEVARLASLMEREYSVEGPLRRQVAQNISRLRDIGCYRGIRHRLAGARPANADERSHAQGSQEDGRRKEGRQGPALVFAWLAGPVEGGCREGIRRGMAGEARVQCPGRGGSTGVVVRRRHSRQIDRCDKRTVAIPRRDTIEQELVRRVGRASESRGVVAVMNEAAGPVRGFNSFG
jgi:small subunit ribosomal protein S13